LLIYAAALATNSCALLVPIFAVGPNTLFNILHPSGHHVLLSRESPHRHIRRSQSDRLNALDLGTKVGKNALDLGTKVGTNVLDLLLELLLDFIVALIYLPDNRGRTNASGQKTGTVNVKQLCHKNTFY
jgi:hypothetical protein